MPSIQYDSPIESIVATVDSDVQHVGLSLSELAQVESDRFYVDRAPADQENAEPGPDTLCIDIADDATPPAIYIVSGSTTMEVPTQSFVGHPIRRPH